MKKKHFSNILFISIISIVLLVSVTSVAYSYFTALVENKESIKTIVTTSERDAFISSNSVTLDLSMTNNDMSSATGSNSYSKSISKNGTFSVSLKAGSGIAICKYDLAITSTGEDKYTKSSTAGSLFEYTFKGSTDAQYFAEINADDAINSTITPTTAQDSSKQINSGILGNYIIVNEAGEETTTQTWSITSSFYNLAQNQAEQIGKKYEHNIKVVNINCKNVASPTNTYTYNYTGTEQSLTASNTGIYKLETWGAQGGGNAGGKGAYSVGYIKLNKNEVLYINVGGKGGNFSNTAVSAGGYNGGGNGGYTTYVSGASPQGGAGGGGATHIALKSGLLSTLSSNIDKILIVSGGGGGGNGTSTPGGSGGGINGNDGGYSTTYPQYHGTGATQTSGGYNYVTSSNYGTFGLGSSLQDQGYGGHGGGGGFYGGGGTNRSHSGGGGGSGYIGNTKLVDKVMYCLSCTESSKVATKTKSTSNSQENAKSKYTKTGNGYAKISYLTS